jgi:hypothetical protein
MSVMLCPRDCGNLAAVRQNPVASLRPGLPEYLFDCPSCGRSLPLPAEDAFVPAEAAVAG